MGLLDNLAASLRDVVVTISERAEQFKNQSFADACMASCALVSMADGVMQPEERTKVVACIQNIRDLHCFKATALRDSFDGYCKQSGEIFSRVEVIKAIRKVRQDPDQADMVVKIGIIIAKSKGTALADCEKVVIREIIHELGLNEGDYDLGSAAAVAAPVSAAPAAPASTAPAPTITPRPAPNPGAVPQPATLPPVAAQSAAQAHQPRVKGTSLKEAKAGERISFKQLAGAAPSAVSVGLGWDAAADAGLTAVAVIFDKDKKVLQKVQLGAATASGVAHNGNVGATSPVGDDEDFTVSLAALPSEAASILFFVRNTNGKPVSNVKNLYVRISDTVKKVQLIRFDYTPTGAPLAFLVGRIYLNNGEWKFAAIGDAVQSGDVDKQLASFA